MWEAMVGEPYREDEIGMTVRNHWTNQDAWVFHSEWWLREHWGRAFEIADVARPPRLEDGSPQITHSYLTARKRPGAFTPRELERGDSGDPRELAGLETNVRLLRAEAEGLNEELNAVRRAPEPDRMTSVLREAVLRSPLGGPAREIRRRLRARR
jgi:hypothetical protein